MKCYLVDKNDVKQQNFLTILGSCLFFEPCIDVILQ